MQTALCPAHVTDLVLREHIAARATQTHCHYCIPPVSATTPISVTFDDFMQAFMVGVDFHFHPHDHSTGEQPARRSAIESRQVSHEILEIAGISHPTLVDDVVTALSPTPQWLRRDYRRGNRIEQLSDGWEAFKHLVKYEMRFFFANRSTGSGEDDDMTALQLLEAVSDVGQHTPAVWPVPCPSPLFRARMARSKDEAAQWTRTADLGPPPRDRAAANRMSPAGISIFYGATDRGTAIAEAGSHTFYRYVVTGEFTPTRPIRLIDLTNIPPLPSIFDSGARLEYFGLRFLQKFVDDVTLPVEVDGHEHIDYVPTQVFTEYIRYAFPAAVDGLMFPSTQGPGHNVVIFVGPDECADKGSETAATRLIMNTDTVTASRVMTVARD